MHVLSLPPAFVLSQDQTLKFFEILQSRLVTPTGHFRSRALRQRPRPILDEFQTHPLPKKARPSQSASRRSRKAAPLQKRDEFLKRDRQLSLKASPPNQPLRSRKSANPTARPRKDNAAHVSLPSDAIVKQQRIRKNGSRARSQIRRTQTLLPGETPAKRGSNSNSTLLPAFARQERPEILTPASRLGGVHSRKSRNPSVAQPKKRAKPSGEAHIGPRRFSVNAVSQRNPPPWKSAPIRAV